MFSFLLAQAEVSWAIRRSIFLVVHAAQERGVPLTELASFLRAADPFHHLQVESEVLCEHLHVTEFHTTPGSSISCLRQCSRCFPYSSAGTAEPQQACLVPVTLAGQNEKRNAKCSPNPPSLDRVNFFYAFYPFWLWNFNWISKCRSEATDHCRQSGLSPRSSLEHYVYNCADVIRISVQITKVEGTQGNQCYFPTVFQGFQLHCIFLSLHRAGSPFRRRADDRSLWYNDCTKQDHHKGYGFFTTPFQTFHVYVRIPHEALLFAQILTAKGTTSLAKLWIPEKPAWCSQPLFPSDSFCCWPHWPSSPSSPTKEAGSNIRLCVTKVHF